MDELYDQVQSEIHTICKQDVVGDWNANAGNMKEEKVIGLYDLGK